MRITKKLVVSISLQVLLWVTIQVMDGHANVALNSLEVHKGTI